MLSWVGEDLSPEKDFSIVRYILTPGEGHGTPNDGALVDVHIVGKYQDTVFEERDVSFPIGEGCESDVIEGVEKAVEKFKKGETSKLIIKSKYAFGDKENQKFKLPANADVEYVVTLKTFQKVSYHDLRQDFAESGKIFSNSRSRFFSLFGKIFRSLANFFSDN